MSTDLGCMKSSCSQPLGPLEKLGGTLMSLSLFTCPKDSCHENALGCVEGSLTNRTIILLVFLLHGNNNYYNTIQSVLDSNTRCLNPCNNSESHKIIPISQIKIIKFVEGMWYNQDHTKTLTQLLFLQIRRITVAKDWKCHIAPPLSIISERK